MTLRHPLDVNAIAADEYYEHDDAEPEPQEEMDEDDYAQTWRGSRWRYNGRDEE